MCDYSLMQLPNRLATEGEDLVTYRFPSGSIGLASPADLQHAAEVKTTLRQAFWLAVKKFFNPVEACSICAVCIPPGARLRLRRIGTRLQREYGLRAEEQVTFEQLTAAAHTYRDAIRFQNGEVIRLQELPEGQSVTVIDLGSREVTIPEFEREAPLAARW